MANLCPSGGVPYQLLDIFTAAKPDYGWWTYQDLLLRALLRPIILHYYNMITHPFSYFTYTWMHMKLWYYPPTAILMCMFYPLVPLLVFVARMVKEMYWLMLSYINPSAENWESGNVWFREPDSFIKKMIWRFAKDFSAYTTGFWLIGNSQDGIDHTLYDYVTHKDYWRSLFERTGVRYPKRLGRFENNKMSFDKEVKCDVVIKIVDSYLGLGDQFLTYGRNFNSNEDLEKLITQNKSYAGKSIIIIEWVRPDPTIGVHQIDVVTVKTNKHGVVPISILIWADCTGNSSHSSQCGYIVDYETETIVSATEWYTYFFLGKPSRRIGQKIEGIKQGVQECIKMHQEIKEPWLRAVGWDFMVTRRSEKVTEKSIPTKNVFFEGNYAHQRFPRRVFLTWKTFFASIKHWAEEMSTSAALDGRM